MNGGMAFIASGADTCVYDPPVGCDPPPDPPFDLKNKVSRIVSYDSGELKNQVLLEQVLIKIESVFPSIRKYVNLNTDACIPKFKPEDKQGSCKIAALKQADILVNLITPKQGDDLSDFYKTGKTKSKLFSDHMRKLTVAMSYINEYGMIHTDLHGKNISVLDGRLIAHDWGRAFISKNQDDYNINVYYTLENIKVFETRAETKYVLPIMTNTGYFKNVVDPINQKEKVDSVLKRSWDTLGLIGTSEKYEIITKESVNKFLTAFVELVKKGPVNENFSNNLRKIIPIAFGQMRGGAKLSQTNRFCKCIKKVKRTFRNEKGPIAVCVKSVLWKQGRTLKRFKCGRNARVITQRRK
jgi:hypothetical protein